MNQRRTQSLVSAVAQTLSSPEQIIKTGDYLSLIFHDVYFLCLLEDFSEYAVLHS